MTCHVYRRSSCEGVIPDPMQMSLRSEARAPDIHKAAIKGDVATVDLLLLNGEDINCRESIRGYTPLHDAACNGHVPVVELLLECRANVNLGDFRNYVPLHEAAWMGHTSVVKTLLAGSAEAMVTARNSTTPLYWAHYNGHTDVVQAIQDAMDMPDVVVTLHVARNAASEEWKMSCTTMGGHEIDVAHINPFCETVDVIRSAVALKLKIPPSKLQIVLPQGELLNVSDIKPLLSEVLHLGSEASAPREQCS